MHLQHKTIMIACMLVFAACSVFLPEQGAEGQPCTDGGLCLDGLICTPQGMCVSNYTPDGDQDTTDPDMDTDQDMIPDGDADGDSIPDGDTDPDPEPEADEGIEAETDPETDGDIATDTDPDVDEDIEPDPEVVCTSHQYWDCFGGDVYWFDSCNQREEKKEECDNCGCSDHACTQNNEYSYQCHEGNVYWYDCHGTLADMKEDCGVNACADGACQACSGGICIDSVTGQEWQEVPSDESFTWEEAKTHCQNLDLDGGGWRLPNVSELRSLIRNCAPIGTGGACGVQDECEACGVSADSVCLESTCEEEVNCNPASCNDSGGPNGCFLPEYLLESCDWYWSSSAVADDANKAWHVRYNFGEVVKEYITYSRHARCVR